MQRLVALVAATAVLWNLAGARGSAIEQPPEPGEASTLGEATATLTVITEPVAATVYVAGRPRGETPVEVAGLPAGDHRVTIVKEGYINNSRVVALAPNQAERLNVALTASAGGGTILKSSEAALERLTQTETPRVRARSARRTWIGIGLLGFGTLVSAAASQAVCVSSSERTTINGRVVSESSFLSCDTSSAGLGVGLGIATSGLLLATVWADVPVARHVEFALLPGGARLGVSVGFGRD